MERSIIKIIKNAEEKNHKTILIVLKLFFPDKLCISIKCQANLKQACMKTCEKGHRTAGLSRTVERGC